jgi:hypothetical protein
LLLELTKKTNVLEDVLIVKLLLPINVLLVVKTDVVPHLVDVVMVTMKPLGKNVMLVEMNV